MILRKINAATLLTHMLSLFLWTDLCFASQELERSLEEIEHSLQEQSTEKIEHERYFIKNIFIEGNKSIQKEPILARLGYKIGDKFDPKMSGTAINNIYRLGHFRQVEIEADILDEESLDLYVIVKEKKLLENLTFEGNKAISTSKIKEKLRLKQLTVLDEETLQHITNEIKKLYEEEHKHFVVVETHYTPSTEDDDRASAHIKITEGPRSSVVRVKFVGNKNLPDRVLNKMIFTRENWLLGFTDGSGTYKPEELELDKHRLEYLYRDHGYMMAKIYKVETEFSQDKRDVTITFHVDEGEQFRIGTITVQGDDVVSETKLLPLVSLKEGEPFSQSELVSSINRLKDLWGEKGYIFADVYPHIKPDEEQKLVDISFMVERGNQLYVNRIDITGNLVTRDKIIRRQFDIYEGDLITSKRLRNAKNAVEYLSFFEREGVNWKIHRVSNDKANLEMNVKEAKTGSFNIQATYGSDKNSSEHSLRGQLTLEKGNLFGRGWDVGLMLQASRSGIKKFEGRFFEPYLLDSNVSMGVFGYIRWDEYDQWKNMFANPTQRIAGGDVKFGFRLTPIDKRTQVMIDLGIEDIKTPNLKELYVGGNDSALFNPVISKTFQEGTMTWIAVDLVRDTRNHQVYPNKGHKIILATKTALPGINHQFNFFKAELGLSWYQALMGVDTLVLGTQFKAGIVRKIGNKINTLIPYKELFHMGGQNTVRGFVWGGIEPAWKATGDPLGAQNMLQFNAELIFPLIPDYSMKGHVFYDAGAGWDTPKDQICDTSLIKRDKFNVRHSVGFGLNLLKPFPAKIDWGFKLDRRKHDGESPHEFHLSMNYAF